MTDRVAEAVLRLTAWIRDYGAQKQPAFIADLETVLAEVQSLSDQFPEGMDDCTIFFRECPKGHGWLTARNWVQHDCPVCERNALKAEVERLQNRYERCNITLATVPMPPCTGNLASFNVSWLKGGGE